MGGSDIDSLLRNGYWPNSRAKSPASRRAPDTPYRSSYAYHGDRSTPRKVAYHPAQKPPPPSVEDESDALAKEAGSVLSSEEPPNRGELDQYPIILPVDEEICERNPERRFVLVSNSSDSSDGSSSEKKRGRRQRSTERFAEPDPVPYEANTGRKYESYADREEKTVKKEEARRDSSHHRSRPKDLPPIVTDGADEERSQKTRRARSNTTSSRDEDYFSPHPPASSRTTRENLLSPDVIEHTTNGRDRSYYRGGSAQDSKSRNRSAHPNDQYNRGPTYTRGHDRESKSAHSFGTMEHKRRTSELPQRTRRGSKEQYESPRRSAQELSSRPDRRIPSPTHFQADQDTGSQHSSTAGDTRLPPHYNDTFYSSEDESRSHTHRRIKSAMPAMHTEYLSTPVDSQAKTRRKSRGQSPSRSPRRSQNSLVDPYSSSSGNRSSTFPRESGMLRDEERASGHLPRASTSRISYPTTQSTIPATMGSTTGALSSSNPGAPVEHRRSPLPPLPREALDSRLQPPTPTISAPTWQPPKFEPPPSGGTGPDIPISSYRRYSTEVQTGELPDIPQCPRTRPEAGHMDWLTLPRCDNFNICSACYNANFASTEFVHDFVPMPFRPRDRPLACDFGSSEYYRIAWLFTRKYGRADLGLFHGLTKLAAQSEPCSGYREASRVWKSILDPGTGRPVDNFTVCETCASTVETLLPGLTGAFVYRDPAAERERGVCALHHDRGHDRGRFLLYFDLFEGAADRAIAAQSVVNVQALADRIRQVAAIPPCPGDRAKPGAYWHTMRGVPLAACPECFLMVVQPLLDSGGGGGGDSSIVSGQFHVGPGPQGDETTCMLFSDRMRSVFNRAVVRRDLPYLHAKVAERIEKKQEFEARSKALQRHTGTSWYEAERERILREWMRYE